MPGRSPARTLFRLADLLHGRSAPGACGLAGATLGFDSDSIFMAYVGYLAYEARSCPYNRRHSGPPIPETERAGSGARTVGSRVDPGRCSNDSFGGQATESKESLLPADRFQVQGAEGGSHQRTDL